MKYKILLKNIYSSFQSSLAAIILTGVLSFISVLQADNVINDDLIVTQSACIGQDCNNGESFGFDTIRLKENNLRIRAMDTSNSASFPTNDWEITFNETSNGGANKFSITDIDGGKVPFTIEASAPSHSLYVDDGGRIGIGTSTPVVEMHVVNGDSPTLRLEQDGSSGFTPQTWDVAGNETNFFIRDATNGSPLPFRIRPSAPQNSLFIDTDGDIGLLTSGPDAQLHVVGNIMAGTSDIGAPTTPATIHAYGSDGLTKLAIEETLTTIADRGLLELTNYGGSRINFNNTSGSTNASNWRVATEDTSGSFVITKIGSGKVELEIDSSGNIITSGTTVHTSDKNKKYNISAVDEKEILEKITNLPISTWSYDSEQPNIRHIGPMAQDFRASFGLGLNDTTIAGVDIDGVALASIKALSLELQKKNKQIIALDKKNQTLTKRLQLLETTVYKRKN